MVRNCFSLYRQRPYDRRLPRPICRLSSEPVQTEWHFSHPVHALNLEKMTRFIRTNHPEALVIAIDASLGEKKHLGYVTIGNGALYPGAGVQKELPPVGDIYITGIVNISGILEQLTLQTTRLSTVISLADVITQGILDVLPEEKLIQTL